MAGVPEVSAEVVCLPVAEIDMGERLRPVDEAWAEALGAIIARDGQDEPISVCRLPGRTRWTLVAGAHRLRGCELAGIDRVKAVVMGADAAERRRREVSENLFRRELDPVDRAAFVSELVTLERLRAGIEADGRAASIEARWKSVKNEAVDTSATIALEYRFTERAAAAAGLSVRTLKYDLSLHRGLAPDVTTRLRGLPIGRNASQLRALAKLEPGLQREAVAALEAGEVKTVAGALALLRQEPKASHDPEAKRLNAVLGNLARMGRAELQGCLDEIAGRYTQGCRMALAKAGVFGSRDEAA